MKITLSLLIQAIMVTSAFAQGNSPKIDPKKFTICTITLNSTHERDAFEANAKKYPREINPMVELTNMGEGDWLDNACKSKLKCDQLIISGHHSGGEFYGDKGKSLGDNRLVELGCSKKCQGILNKPYEVFMFGCTTMTGTTATSYNEGLIDILTKSGIPKQKAKLLSETGTSEEGTKQKFKVAFSGAEKRIYGFTYKAPLGEQIDPFLKKYLKNNNAPAHLNKLRGERIARQVTDANKKLQLYLGHTSLDSCNAGEGKDVDVEKFHCQMNSRELSLDKKIELSLNVMSQDNFMRFIETYNDFVEDYSYDMSEGQKKQLDLIKKNKVIKLQVAGVLKKLNAESVQNFRELVTFAKYLGALTDKEKERLEL